MLNPAQLNLDIRKGRYFRLPLKFRTSGGAPMVLTGYAVRSQICDVPQGIRLLEFHVDIPDAANGRVDLSLDESALVDSLPEQAVYDVVLIDPSGHPQTYIEGNVRFIQGTTKL